MRPDELKRKLSALSPVKRELLLKRLGESAGPGARQPIGPRDGSAPCELSFAQQRQWFLDLLEPGSSAYNVVSGLMLDGPLDIEALERALEAVVARHETLRTTFPSRDGKPFQVVAEPGPFDLHTIDLSELPPAEREAAMADAATAIVDEPFDLANGPIFRGHLIRLGSQSHLLVLVMHHIVSDGWSRAVLQRELCSHYSSALRGEDHPLLELPLQYTDYTSWQHQRKQRGDFDAGLRYWSERLLGLRPLDIPTDHPRPATQSHHGSSIRVELSAGPLSRLRDLAGSECASLFMVMLAAFDVLLQRNTGEDDIAVGVPVAGRNRAEFEGLIGFFVNTVVMRVDLSGNPSFRELIRRARDVALEAYEHQDVPFEQVVDTMQPPRDPGRTPLFQVFFNMLNYNQELPGMSGLEVEFLRVPIVTAKFDLTAYVAEGPFGLTVILNYNTDLFDASRISAMAEGYRALLESVAAAPDVSISEIPVMGLGERQLLEEWSRTDGDRPERLCVHEMFEARAEADPDAVAVVFGSTRLSYGDLDAMAGRIARELHENGVTRGDFVGLCVDSSPEMIAGMLAILKAGGAFIPLDPSYPRARLAAMLSDAGPRLILTRRSLAELVDCGDGEKMFFDDIEADGASAASRGSRRGRPPSPDDPAYVTFTSGSTGRPKGIAVPHRGLVNYLSFYAETYGIGPGDSVLQVASMAFDASFRETVGPLTAGASVVLVPDADAKDPAALVASLRRDRVTCLVSVGPTMLQAMVEGVLREGGPCESLRLVMSCGEVLHTCLAGRIIEHLAPGADVINQYGPAECSMITTFHRFDPSRSYGADVPIGRPIPNARVHVLDSRLRKVPVGVPGELCIAGVGVTRGYLQQPELTKESFVPDPFGGPGEMLYRTGDRCRWSADGELQFLGRLDCQVKLRGNRVEPGEVEAVLSGHPALRQIAVAALGELPEEMRLVAYFVPRSGATPTVPGLRSYLQERLPNYMVPATFVPLQELPLSPNGKVDRAALPEPGHDRPRMGFEAVAPRNEQEAAVAAAWREVLEVDSIGVHDDFFALGGNSITATQVIARLGTDTGVNVSLRQFFADPTVAAIGALIEAELVGPAGSRDDLAPAGPPREAGTVKPLSFAQERLWFIQQLEPDSSHYSISSPVRLGNSLDVAALEWSITEITRRHEPLRTTFRNTKDGPVQVVHEPEPAKLCVVDLSGLPEGEREEEARRLASAEAAKPFDLETERPMRVLLYRLGPEDHVLLVIIHHIAADGWSLKLLRRELAVLYSARDARERSPLAPLSIRYSDYAAWQKEHFSTEAMEAGLAYWRRKLAGAPPLELPKDHSRPARPTHKGAGLRTHLSAQVAASFEDLCRDSGATLFMGLVAVVSALFSRYSGQDDIVIGTPAAGRDRPETEGLIGFFVNTLVLRLDLSGAPTFRDMLARSREVVLETLDHQEIPFEKLVEDLSPDRHVSRSPIFQAMLVLNNQPVERPPFDGLEYRPYVVDRSSAPFDLTLTFVTLSDGSILGKLWYSTDVFDGHTVERMARHLRALLDGALEHPDRALSRLPLMTDEERHRIVDEWNRTEADYPRDRSVHEVFEEQASRTPDAAALVSESGEMTYAELNRQANRLARHIESLGVARGTPVAVLLERSPELVVALLAALKAGGGYVPLDADYPADRLALMISDTAAGAVITCSGLSEGLPDTGAPVVLLDSDRERIESQPGDDLGRKVNPDDLAYVIYTSGSTGRPKGVETTHRGIIRLLFGVDYVSLGPEQTLLLLAPATFDASTFEIWGALLHGGRLVLSREGVPGAAEIERTIGRHGVTTMWLTSSLFNVVVDDRPEALSGLRQLLIGGEALSPPHVRRALEALPGTRIINGYGPTECTTFACCYPIPGPESVRDGRIPIGRPIANTRAYIVDTSMAPTPIGVPGELLLGGDGLARGYLGAPELTAEKFVPDPFGGPGDRLYRTGDRCRWLADGTIEFLGRLDDQVKIRGHRIEPGEIEAALAAHHLVGRAAVAARDDMPGGRSLVAYVVCSGKDVPSVDDLRRHLSRQLPRFMLPTAFVFLEDLPLGPTGKVNRESLPAPLTHGGERGSYPRPIDAVEARLAAIWQEVLGVARVGTQDDFFDLGGHSLLAVRLFAEIQSAFGVHMPISSLFEGATVSDLAKALREEGWRPRWSSLVEIRPEGDAAPFFLVHGAGGNVVGTFGLTKLIDRRRPVYALQSRGLGGDELPLVTIEQMAEHYVREMRSARPDGPYSIGGLCVGGLIAYEMARRLEAEGEEVEFLALFDPPKPVSAGLTSLKPLRALFKRARLRARAWLGPWLSRLTGKPFVLPSPASLNLKARRCFVPRPCGVPVAYFACRGGPGAYEAVEARLALWRGLARGGVTVHDIPGEHSYMLMDPMVTMIAERLNEYAQGRARDE